MSTGGNNVGSGGSKGSREAEATAVAKQRATAVAADNSIRQRMVLELGQRSRREEKRREKRRLQRKLKG